MLITATPRAQGLPTAIGAELCCCPFAKFPEKKLVDAGEAKAAGFARWFYWSTGLIIGTLLMACSLPEVLLGWEDPPPGSSSNQTLVQEGLVTNGFILWWKLILGIGMVLVHTGKKKPRLFCAICYMLKTIILPRQARDKHRENSNRDALSYRRVGILQHREKGA